jgi:two-component system, chemotaxis family, protein-glutamate methylesterase/glutaminase
VCNSEALFQRAHRAIEHSRSLRTSSNTVRLLATQHGASIVLPTFARRPGSASVPASHLVAIAFSAGGLQPLIHILGALPEDFPAAVAIAHHAGTVSVLPQLLRNQTRLTVKFAENGEPLLNGAIYVCPPQQHLIINPDATVRLSANARIRYARPSADWFFRTVAGSFGERALAVVLSGASADGAEGVMRFFEAGGQVFVQDPRTCLFAAMPEAVLQRGRPCGVHGPDELGRVLTTVLQQRDLATAQTEWEQPFGPLAA